MHFLAVHRAAGLSLENTTSQAVSPLELQYEVNPHATQHWRMSSTSNDDLTVKMIRIAFEREQACWYLTITPLPCLQLGDTQAGTQGDVLHSQFA